MANVIVNADREVVLRLNRMVTGRPPMILNSSTKSAALHRQQLWRARRAAPSRRSAKIISRTAQDAVLLEEHVLGAAQADAFGAEPDRGPRVGRRIGVGAALSACARASAHFISVANSPVSSGSRIGTLPSEHLPGRAVDGERYRPCLSVAPPALTVCAL